MLNEVARLQIRPIFLEAARLPRVHFYTSSTDKFLQARLIFDQAGLILRHFRGHTEPYEEDYSLTKEDLLQFAVDQVKESTNDRHSLFFVEDTSLRIEALSAENTDFPGLQVKEWFQRTSFESLEHEISKNGGNREATVKSDIALYVPGLPQAIFFHGETRGAVAPSPSEVSTSVRYPWLSNQTFNGWFIPEGASRRLSEMDFETSVQYDFRIKALTKLVDRLEENVAIQEARQERKIQASVVETPKQVSLFETETIPVFVVIGATCAGKTTFAENAYFHSDFRQVEASSVMRFLNSSAKTNLGSDALEAAVRTFEEKGEDVVARTIVKYFGQEGDRGIVVTGFRHIPELLRFLTHWPNMKVVYVEADERIRFERHLVRGRYHDAQTLEEFRKLSDDQSSLGLIENARQLADVVILNEDTEAAFKDSVVTVLENRQNSNVTRLSKFRARTTSKIYRILTVLRDKTITTSREISDELSRRGDHMETRNVNWVLSQAPTLADRYENPGEQINYQITDAGRYFIRYIDERVKSELDEESGP